MIVKISLIRATGAMGATSQLLTQGTIMVEDITGATQVEGIMEAIAEADIMEIAVVEIMAEETQAEGITKVSLSMVGSLYPCGK